MHRDDLVVRTIDGEVIILDRRLGSVHQLNATAACIWRLFERPLGDADIAAAVAAHFDVPPDVALADVGRTLAEFRRLGLLLDERMGVSANREGGIDWAIRRNESTTSRADLS